MSDFEGLAGNQGASAGAALGKRRPSSATQPLTPVLLTEEQAAALFGVSVRKFAEMRTEAYWKVRPVVLGPRLHRYPYAELVEQVAAMPRQESPAGEPRQLARARIDSMKRGGVSA